MQTEYLLRPSNEREIGVHKQHEQDNQQSEGDIACQTNQIAHPKARPKLSHIADGFTDSLTAFVVNMVFQKTDGEAVKPPVGKVFNRSEIAVGLVAKPILGLRRIGGAPLSDSKCSDQSIRSRSITA